VLWFAFGRASERTTETIDLRKHYALLLFPFLLQWGAGLSRHAVDIVVSGERHDTIDERMA